MRQHLLNLYAGVTVRNSFVGSDGQIVDCFQIDQQPGLRGIVAPSPEETRLVRLYGHKGVDAVIEELRRRP